MGIFSSPKEKNKLILVFHIGSASVGGELFWTDRLGVPKIVFSAHEEIPVEGNVEANRLLSLTVEALKTVGKRVYGAHIGAPAEIFCVLSSPWYVSQTRIVKLEKNTPFIFTSKIANDLIQKEKDLFEAEHSQYASPVRLIELKNLKTLMNGYETPEPLDKKGKSIEMTLFLSMSGAKTLEKLEEAIRTHFHHENIRFSSFALASFTTVRDLFPHSENFLLVNIGGEVTDISMVKQSNLRESTSFPSGLNSLIRGVAHAFHHSPVEAKSLISIWKDGHADKALAKKLIPVVEVQKKDWLKKFEESLAGATKDVSLPSVIYLSVDKGLADFFSETIKSEQFSQYSKTEAKFKVVFLSGGIFQGKAVIIDTVVRDPDLIIDSIYINRFLADHN